MYVCVCVCVCVLVAQLCLTFVIPWTVAHEAPVHGIPMARIVEWGAIPFSGDLPNGRSNPGLLYCTQILYCLSHSGNKNHDTHA